MLTERVLIRANGTLFFSLQNMRASEVGDFEGQVGCKENIHGLDVTVDDVCLMDRLHS